MELPPAAAAAVCRRRLSFGLLLHVVILLLVVLVDNAATAFRQQRINSRDVCVRDPPDIDIDGVNGDHGFRIDVVGRATRYTPGQVYTVVINGTDVNQRFAGFMLVAVPLNAQDETTAIGTFQHIDARTTRFVSQCPHVVTEVSSYPAKSNIEILWTAPSSGAGCVEFRATIVKEDDLWFKDDGALTKVFCEDTRTTEDERPPEMVPDCCACGTAKYQLTFQGNWSETSHPKDYPKQRRLLHWSNIVGASHSRNYMVWQYGGYATRGVKEVCELGYPRTVEEEIQQNGRHVRSLIKTTGIWWAEPHGIDQSRTARFSTDRRRHLMSVLTMIGPSPDWCVGVSALDMCLPNCTWAGDMTIDLYPWDAGTDDGVSYMSPNAKSDPQQKIRRITNSFPDNPQSPFYGPDPIRPLGTLTIRRLNTGNEPEVTSATECTDNADEEFVLAETGDGRGSGTGGLTEMEKQKLMMMNAQDVGKCAMSPWNDWSGCSVTCGVGQRSRKRMYLNQMVDESMCGLPVMEIENCIGLENECESIDEDCAVTQWSTWSPCSATCEKGTRQRLRYYLNKDDMARCSRTTEETEMCAADILDCDKARAMAEIATTCSLPFSVGPCRGSFQRWYYDPSTQQCTEFSYGGCRGNRNRFESLEECESTCRVTFSATTVQTTSATFSRVLQTPSAMCSLPMEVGPCRARIESWYFDNIMQKCLPFTYGGCRGNANRFVTEDQCMNTCIREPPASVPSTQQTFTSSNNAACLLPMEVGPCRARIESWYFDIVMQKCLPFTYGGCHGNENRFTTEDQCINSCILIPIVDRLVTTTQLTTRSRSRAVCLLPMDVGPCRARIESWYFDSIMQKCLPFTYGGCRGNENRFVTEDQCADTCVHIPAVDGLVTTTQGSARPRDRAMCLLPMEVGPCRATIESWYFDTAMQKCLPFMYGGCRGNENRFVTENLCIHACQQEQAVGNVDTTTQSVTYNTPHTRLATLAPSARRHHVTLPRARPIHCILTAWSSWSECSATCGNERPWRIRRREVRQQAANGGRACSQNLEKRQLCDPVDPCPVDGCVLSEWSDWSPCSKTCGNDAVQERERHLVPTAPGVSCSSSVRLLRRICSQLPPCPSERIRRQ